jgi:H+-transporting ATPase
MTFSILTLAWEFYFPTIAIVIIAILNDGTMLTISKDRVKPRQTPDTWNLTEVFSLAFSFGIYLLVSTIVLFVLVRNGKFHDAFNLKILTDNEMRGMIYLQVSISGLATIFVSRSQGFSYRERPGAMMAIAFCISQLAATFIGVYGFNGYPNNGETNFEGCGWGYALAIWIWCIIWYVPMDFIKFFVHNLIHGRWHIFSPTLQHRLHKSIHPHGVIKKGKAPAALVASASAASVHK